MVKLRHMLLLALFVVSALAACRRGATPEGASSASTEAQGEATVQKVGLPLLEVSPLGSDEPQGEAPTRELTASALGISPLTEATRSPSPRPSPRPTPIYTPRPGSATFQGLLFLMNPLIVAPKEDGLYLVRIDEEAPMTVPAVDPETSLQAGVDEVSGRFLFSDVPQGLYALVATTDSGQQFSIRKFETGEALIVTVGENELGQVVDLGQLRLP
jgi:hypothetical protein